MLSMFTCVSGPWSQHLAMSPTENKRQNHIQELIDTEESYVKDMKIVNEVRRIVSLNFRQKQLRLGIVQCIQF